MIVVDANVVVAALRSRNGASNAILREMISGTVPFAVSPAMALEYEDVLKRPGILGNKPWVSAAEIDTVLDTVLSRAKLVSPWFRQRPFLEDPKDDLYIECALAAGARTIISSDRHFAAPVVSGFGLSVMKAGEFLADLKRRSH